ncbi:MAG: prolipoprotein diacylglyceryl transferase [Pseudomonadota bacterium]
MEFFIADFDPVALRLGPLQIRWYSLAYIAGFLIGLHYARTLTRLQPQPLDKATLERLLLWVIPGVILGGRLGHVVFYYPDYYFANPVQILKIWQGGMAFHGGVIGIILAVIGFCRHERIQFFIISDLIAAVAPIGLFAGRIANFINGELWGRPASVPWAVIFPNADAMARHPSQLYEAALEGVVLFILLSLAAYQGRQLHRPGRISALFLIFYGLARCLAEFWREPEILAGFLPFATWGQWLSLPMILAGLWLLWRIPARSNT